MNDPMIDREIFQNVRDRLAPGSRAYAINTPHGRVLLANDRRLGSAAVGAILELLDKIEREDRRVKYTDIEDTILRALNAASDAFEDPGDAPERTSPITSEHAAALRIEAARTEPYDVVFDGIREPRHRYVHDRRSRRQLLDEASRIEARLAVRTAVPAD